MKKERYHYMFFLDPAGQQNKYHYCRDLLEPLGCGLMRIVFESDVLKADVDEIAEDRFIRRLVEGDNSGAFNEIPADSRVMLNVERPSVNVLIHYSEQNLWYQPNQPGIDLRFRILEIAKKARPDCTFGFYGQMPNTTYDGVLNTGDRVPQWRRELHTACYPLAEECDFLIPEFYDEFFRPKHDTFDDRLQWVRKGLTEAKQSFPEKPVLSIFIVEYLDLWRGHYNPPEGVDPIPDTPEAQRFRLLSAYKWQELHRIADELADGTIWWMNGPAGTNPMPLDSEWWHVTQRILQN